MLALVTLREKLESQKAEEKRLAEERDHNRVFAKSCLRGEGCNDAGEEQEPHTHFASMAFYQAVLPADPASDNDVVQHAQTAKKRNLQRIFQSRRSEAPCINGGMVITKKSNTSGQ